MALSLIICMKQGHFKNDAHRAVAMAVVLHSDKVCEELMFPFFIITNNHFTPNEIILRTYAIIIRIIFFYLTKVT